jgi:hypothetical protein
MMITVLPFAGRPLITSNIFSIISGAIPATGSSSRISSAPVAS